MIKNSAVRGALCAGMLALALAAPLCSAQTDASQPTSPDISKRVEDLEKELADLKAQLAAQSLLSPRPLPPPRLPPPQWQPPLRRPHLPPLDWRAF